jgi:hypothetical protein
MGPANSQKGDDNEQRTGALAQYIEQRALACAACQTQCDACFEHCAELLVEGDKDRAKSMQTCVDCAECCKLAATQSARQSPFAAAACECCAKCCCAMACGRFPDDKHMSACAKACREGAKACREMIKHGMR